MLALLVGMFMLFCEASNTFGWLFWSFYSFFAFNPSAFVGLCGYGLTLVDSLLSISQLQGRATNCTSFGLEYLGTQSLVMLTHYLCVVVEIVVVQRISPFTFF